MSTGYRFCPRYPIAPPPSSELPRGLQAALFDKAATQRLEHAGEQLASVRRGLPTPLPPVPPMVMVNGANYTRPRLCARISALRSALDLLAAQSDLDQRGCFPCVGSMKKVLIQYEASLRKLDQGEAR